MTARVRVGAVEVTASPATPARQTRTGKPAGPAVFVSEKQLGDTLRDACKWTGWRSAHFRPAQTAHGWRTAVQGDGKGFPDWVLVHDRGGVVFVELNAEAKEPWRDEDDAFP